MEEKRYTDVEASEMSRRYDNEKENYVWVDVRTAEEYEAGHVPGSIHIPFDELDERGAELDEHKERTLMLICRSGRRSVIAAHTLHEQGFSRLFNLKGGMLEWSGPVEE
ncbi:rhodanese-like domain-containing protein [Desmospora profundinema]|uniref:Rhodanese-related sulfurtransferase n=1 Tax=Desmospora profundinema TaxID=1571184 RepID=A0ABU1IJG7_9BACL|nr:rhodanese-like domain-containing protein [Desmospora profundinema]MDR6224826.1 rhodanese-related sulfurtransferase [Desmospora profundinema]